MYHEEIELNFDASCQQNSRFEVRNLVGTSQHAYLAFFKKVEK
jgi:hypothetical protein